MDEARVAYALYRLLDGDDDSEAANLLLELGWVDNHQEWIFDADKEDDDDAEE